MKGIISTELCEMIEGKFGIETLNEVIKKSERKLSKFAIGFIERTIEHFGDHIEITEEKSFNDDALVKIRLVHNA